MNEDTELNAVFEAAQAQGRAIRRIGDIAAAYIDGLAQGYMPTREMSAAEDERVRAPYLASLEEQAMARRAEERKARLAQLQAGIVKAALAWHNDLIGDEAMARNALAAACTALLEAL